MPAGALLVAVITLPHTIKPAAPGCAYQSGCNEGSASEGCPFLSQHCLLTDFGRFKG